MDILKFSSINNASIFDMNMSVRNLPTAELMVSWRW